MTTFARPLRTAVLITLTALLVGIFFVVFPFGLATFESSKIAIFLSMVLVSVLLYTGSIIASNRTYLTTTPLTLPALALLTISTVGMLTVPAFPWASLAGYGGVFVGFSILLLVLPSLIAFVRNSTDSDSTNSMRHTLEEIFLILGGALGFTAFLEVFGVGPSLLYRGIFFEGFVGESFLSVGSFFIAAQVLLVALVMTGVKLFYRLQDTATDMKPSVTTLAVTGSFILLGLLASAWQIRPGGPATPVLLPHSAAWNVAIRTLETPRSAFFGVGPDSFGTAYTQLRPNWLNTTELWNIQFTQSSNVPFTLLSTMGILGLGVWIWIGVVAVRSFKEAGASQKPLGFAVLTILLLQLLTPPTVVLWVLLAFLLSLWMSQERYISNWLELHPLKTTLDEHYRAQTENHGRLFSGVMALVLILAIAGASYALGRDFIANYNVYAASAAVSQNDGQTLYTRQQAALRANPYRDQIRRGYATTNLRLATSLANNIPEDATEQERQTQQQQVSQLVQQAIREGRAAVTLEPRDTQNWRTLGRIYQNLLGIAEGAENWAITSFTNAIQTAPADPTARVELGGIYYRLEQYDQASQLFLQAANLKPDYANAYYNLANSLRQIGDYQAATQAYQQTLLLLETDSEDYLAASEELEEVSAMAQEATASSGIAEQLPPAQETDATQPPLQQPGANSTQLPVDDVSLLEENIREDQLNIDSNETNNADSEDDSTATTSAQQDGS